MSADGKRSRSRGNGRRSQVSERNPTIRSKTRSNRGRKQNTALLSVVIVLVLALVGSCGFFILKLVDQSSKLKHAQRELKYSQDDLARMQQTESELRACQSRLNESEEQVGEFKRNKFQDKMPIDFNAVSNVGKHNVQSVLFYKTVDRNVTRYKYQLTLKNTSTVSLQPNIRLIVTDQAGKLLGESVISEVLEQRGEEQLHLAPGDTHVVDAKISLFRRGEPTYFAITGGR